MLFSLIVVPDSEFVLNFPARQSTSYVETITLPSLQEFTICFWMKRGYDGALEGGLISYATTQEAKSLTVHLGSVGGLNIRVMDSRYSTTY